MIDFLKFSTYRRMFFRVFPKNSKFDGFLPLLAALLLWACALPVWAQNHITSQAWLEDQSGNLVWEDVKNSPLQAYEGVLSKGFGRSPLWIRLRIDPMAHPISSREPEKLILRIRPVYLDDIQVFDPLAPGGRAGVTGDLHHPRGQAFEGLDFMLPLARGEAPRDIWLRVASTSTRQLAVEVVNLDNLNRLIHTQELLYALYIGVIIVFAIWAMVYWLFSREHLVGAFALSQLSALFFAFCSLGYARAFWPAALPASWLNQLTSLFSILAVSSAIFFHVLNTREFDLPPWINRVVRLLLLLLPVKLLLLLIQQPMISLNLNMMEILIGPTVFLLAAIQAKGWRQTIPGKSPALSRPYAVGFYALLWVIMLIAALPGLALSDGGEIPLYIVQAHGLVTAFLILMMLQYRDRVRRLQQNDIALSLERTQMQALQERNIREEQEKLMAMLAHEIKTPLATMHMRLNSNMQGSKEIRQAIRDMNNVIERCLQTTQFSDRQLQAQKTRLDLVDLVRDAMSSSAQPERMTLECPSELFVETDRQLLFIAMNNLLENACKYAAPETPIRIRIGSDISAQSRRAEARIDISNLPGASGWPDPDKVFDKYYRSPSARRQAGTGLGLYLVGNLMKVLGGGIDYLPDGQQIRFSLSLPMASQR